LGKFAAERGFYPGRQIFKFEPALEKVTRRNNLLYEDRMPPDYTDPTFFARYRANQFEKPREYFRGVPVAQPGKTNTLRLENRPGLTITSIRIETVY